MLLPPQPTATSARPGGGEKGERFGEGSRWASPRGLGRLHDRHDALRPTPLPGPRPPAARGRRGNRARAALPGPRGSSPRSRTWSTLWPAAWRYPGGAGRPRWLRSPPRTSGPSGAQASTTARPAPGRRPGGRAVPGWRAGWRRGAGRRGGRRAPRGARASGAAPGAVLVDVPAHEDRVGAAARRLDDVGPALRGPAAQRQQLVARGQRRAVLGARGARPARAATTAAPPGAARRPIPTRPARARTHRAARAGRGHGPAVEEVPGDHPHGLR